MQVLTPPRRQKISIQHQEPSVAEYCPMPVVDSDFLNSHFDLNIQTCQDLNTREALI